MIITMGKNIPAAAMKRDIPVGILAETPVEAAVVVDVVLTLHLQDVT